ncbi:unnamed protein product [Cylicostephanus goldi]|uniref:Uncharacterized protein n=1 Tax=Cylicostephanus goldi TaxID=71465 RepID=A0A3P6QJQ9_CYLGO|nr:unnamed protein product [Cylicostephanus goldi]
MLISTSVLLLLFVYTTKQDSLEDPSAFEDLTDDSGTRHRFNGPLPPLPDMTGVRRVEPGPPGIRPPAGFIEELKNFHEEMGVVSKHGKKRIMGVSRRKPTMDDSFVDA